MSNDKSILNLFYEYSNLFAKGINRKEFVLESSESTLHAKNNSKNTYFSIILTFLSLGLFFTGLVEIITNQTKITLPFIIIFFVIHPIFGFVGLRHFIWLIRGWHEIKIIDGKLIVKNNGTIFIKSKGYVLSEINNLELAIYVNDTIFDKIMYNISLNHKLLFRQTFGAITFMYNRRKIKIFGDLTIEEAEKLIFSINELKGKQ